MLIASMRNRKSARRPQTRSFQPRLELLEDRLAPSAGMLDPTFDGDGKVVTSGWAGGKAEDIVIHEGKIVAISGDTDFAIRRYLSDGLLDPNFGTEGTTYLGSPVGALDFDAGRAVVLQDTGKILVAGRVRHLDNPEYLMFGLARFERDGALDVTFGVGGILSTDFGVQAQTADMVLQRDGKIVVTGYTLSGTTNHYVAKDVALARYNRDGTLDASFGSGGKVTTDFGERDRPTAVALQSDGKIVVAGNLGPQRGAARYTSAGALDLTFGLDGIVSGNPGVAEATGAHEILDVAVQPDDKIVAVGSIYYSSDGRRDFAVFRFESNGSSDQAFGTRPVIFLGGDNVPRSGSTLTDLGGDDIARAVAIQDNGKIVVVGETTDGTGDSHFGLARYTPEGMLDAEFGTAGIATTNFTAADSLDSAHAVAIQCDGKIVAAGDEASSFGFALARYEGDPISCLSISDMTVTEGNGGTTSAAFTVSLSYVSSDTVTVAYTTTDGSATAGNDYQSVSGTLTFAPGETSKTVTVLVMGDRLAEPNETFFVNLSGAANTAIANGRGTGTIVDDEPRVSISDATKTEGRKSKITLFTFTVTLSAVYDQAVTMSYRTVDGTAKADEDYVAKTGTITFAPGETTKTITIEVKGDSKKEADETFYLDLFGLSSNALFTKYRGLGTILNDD